LLGPEKLEHNFGIEHEVDLADAAGSEPLKAVLRRTEGKGMERDSSELLANERAVGPLLSYLKNTEVGSREGAVEVTREWRRRSDEEGGEHLGNS